MVFFNDHKIGFIHIPRTGGSSIEKKATYSFELDKHLTLSQFKQKWLDKRDYSFYTIIREPVERFISEFMSCQAPNLGINSGQTLDQFIDDVEEIVKKRNFNQSEFHNHFVPQLNFIIEHEEIGIDFIYLFSEIKQCITDLCDRMRLSETEVPHLNKTFNEKPIPTSDQVERITKIYQGDVNFYQFLVKAKKSIFLMTSVVNNMCLDAKTYYDSEERFNQACSTVQSIRKYCPGAKICWIEGSQLSDEQTKYIESKSDYYLNHYHGYMADEIIAWPCKAVGECYLLASSLIEIKDRGDWDIFFKISGRYLLNDEFNYNRFHSLIIKNNKIIAKSFPKEEWAIAICYTCLYAVPRNLIKDWVQNILWMLLKSNRADKGDVSLNYEPNFMVHNESDYFILLNETIGLTIRSWSKNGKEELANTSNI